jgi:hypothetical protein
MDVCATRRANPVGPRFRPGPKVLELTCSEPPVEATHWTGRAMAMAFGISLRAVQRLWDGVVTLSFEERERTAPLRIFKPPRRPHATWSSPRRVANGVI